MGHLQCRFEVGGVSSLFFSFSFLFFLAMESMTGTTWGSDFYQRVWRKLYLPWTKSLNGTNLTERNSGFLQRIQDQARDANPSSDVNFLHCIIHQESLCKSVFSLVAEIGTKYQFCVNMRT